MHSVESDHFVHKPTGKYCACPHGCMFQLNKIEKWITAIIIIHVTVFVIVGLATFYAWARAKHFGFLSVILSVCYPGMPL